MIGEGKLQRKLGLSAVIAIVIGDMLGSGIFFTPGELASVASSPWQIYFIWTLCGLITLCGALTVAELATLFPRAGSTYHIIYAGFGSFFAFLKIWIEIWISGPGSIAGVAIVFGDFASKFMGISPVAAGIMAILLFTLINLLGVQWGGGIQMILTGFKISALVILIAGSLIFIDATHTTAVHSTSIDLFELFQLIGLGVAAVLFTYDGWIDVTHVAGEVKNPERNLPAGLAIGVGVILVVYLAANFAFLRIVPMEEMKQAPTLIAATVADRILGPNGGTMLSLLIMISILGALGGLVMTLPRLYYAAAGRYEEKNFFFRSMASVSRRSVPWVSILFSGFASIIALLLFQSFSRLVNFFVVPLQFANILVVATIFKIRNSDGFRTPGFPVVPLIYILVLAMFMISAAVFRAKEAGIGILLAMTAIPVYFWIEKRERR